MIAPARPPGRAPSLLRSGLLLLLLVPVALPLLRPGWIQSHEGLSYPMRLAQVARCWEDGLWSARWFPDLNNGQGYPFLSFYAPGLFFLAGLFHAAGASLALSLKLPVLLGAAAGAAGAYRLARLATGPPGAFVAAALFTYAPYHVRDLFIRGDLTEYVAAGVLPWSLFAVLRLRRRRAARDILFVAVTGALPILTHNILGLFTGGMMVVAALAATASAGAGERVRTAAAALVGGAGTLLLTAFFWAPALHEKQFVRIDAMTQGIYAVEENFVSALDLVARPAVPGIGQDLPMSFELGLPALVLLAVAALTLRKAPASARPVLALSGVAFLGGLLLATPLGAPVYRAVPLLRFVQFPWRFFVLVSLGAAVLGGAGLGAFLDRRRSTVRLTGAAVAVVMIVAAVRPILGPKPNGRIPGWAVDPAELARTRQTTTGVGEYQPVWVTEREAPRGFERGVKVVGEGRARGTGRRAGRYDFTVEAAAPVTVILRDVYFPGWEATANGASLVLGPLPGPGLIRFELPSGTHQIRARLEPTSLRRDARRVSAAAAALALIALGGTALPVGRPRRPRASPGGPHG